MAETGERLSNGHQVAGVSIRLAAPDTIRNWSYGEVTKPETINYRSFKPERDGLFCEKIFGPVRNWECNCGKYKRIRYRGVVCDRCGVEVTHSRVRRERMGHIELAVPIVHIWFLRSVPSHIAYLLGLSTADLDRIVYYQKYVVLDPGDTQLRPHQLIDDEEYEKLEDGKHKFVAKMGGEAVLEMLATVDLEELATDLRTKSRLEPSEQRRADHLKRLRVVEAFLKSGNNPEHMVLRVLPVLPPDLRPLVPLEGGRFATSDLNDLYRRVLNRNIRLKKLIEIKAPDVILRNEMRMLQEAVDTLFDNGRRSFSVKGEGKRPLKSLSDILRGKQGRFRQNLLGKRVDYSGRSVIVVGPELRIHQCGLPKTMALELFKPYVIQKLEERSLVQTVKGAKKYVEKERPEVWDILEEVIKDHPVLLNRAPTLHRLGIQAFFPVLVEGKAIRLHPLVCHAFNADFDGDQMAVHVPLSFESQLECRMLMLSANNLLSPADGRPVMTPTQDIVLGAYYLTKMAKGRKGAGRVFADSDEVVYALENKQIDLHADIKVRIGGRLIETTAGRVLFNRVIPEGIGFRNELMKKGKVQQLVEDVIRAKGARVTCKFLDDLKDLGYEAATRAGITFGMEDLVVPREKNDIISRASKEVERIRSQYRRGIITEGERYNKIIDVWMHATNEVADRLYQSLEQDKDGFNPVFVMMNSEARGSKDQIKQLAGMRGLMQKPQKTITGAVGEIIENPIISSLKDGLSVLEYFISTHGARKGLADTALKTADAGYLTRRLVDVVQDVVVTIDDCHTTKGIEIEALREGDDLIEPLRKRIVGRVTKDEIRHPVTDELICEENTLIDDALAKRLEDADVETVVVRSVLTCEAERGCCQMCYGRNLATGKLVDIGETVGIMAAQSIGEPGTQLTLRTFHIGGTASRLIAQSRETAKSAGTVQLIGVEAVHNEARAEEVAKAEESRGHGAVSDADRKNWRVVTSRSGEIAVMDAKGAELQRFDVPYGALLRVTADQKVAKGDVLCEWDPYNNLILAPKAGAVKYVDLKPGVTYREDEDRLTGERIRVVIDDRQKQLHAHLHIVGDDGARLANITVPTDGVLQVRDGDRVKEGDTLVKLPRESARSRDITGGLPRVAELFEARRPKNSAVLTEIDGVVKFPKKEEERIERNNRVVFVENEQGDSRKYLIEMGKHLRVHEGDHVRAGDQLSEGARDPHDILKIKGEAEVQKYLLNQIQAVYRLQGVTINDKHIEVIISQMLRKVRVESSGDTSFLEGDLVDRKRLVAENLQLEEGEKKGEPATFKPYLQGITKASLSTESFLSAASFQETTKVLSRAAVEGRTDHLRGLKENLIMGNLIPSGTGARVYRGLKVRDLETDTVEVEQQEPQGDFVDIGGELA